MRTSSVHLWDEQMLEAWQKTRSIIANVLYKYNKFQEADLNDIHQQTWLAAHLSLPNFDHAKGNFPGWVSSISYRQSHLFIRQEISKRKHDEAACESLAWLYDQSSYHQLPELIATGELTFRYARVQEVLNILATYVDVNDDLHRTLFMILACNNSPQKAAAELGVPIRTLRGSYQRILTAAHIIDKGLDIYWSRHEKGESSPVTMKELLNCMPADAMHGTCAQRKITEELLRRQHLKNISPKHLQEKLGYSSSYSERALQNTVKHLSLAKTVIETGGWWEEC